MYFYISDLNNLIITKEKTIQELQSEIQIKED